jgi:hypothetical protein
MEQQLEQTKRGATASNSMERRNGGAEQQSPALPRSSGLGSRWSYIGNYQVPSPEGLALLSNQAIAALACRFSSFVAEFYAADPFALGQNKTLLDGVELLHQAAQNIPVAPDDVRGVVARLEAIADESEKQSNAEVQYTAQYALYGAANAARAVAAAVSSITTPTEISHAVALGFTALLGNDKYSGVDGDAAPKTLAALLTRDFLQLLSASGQAAECSGNTVPQLLDSRLPALPRK